MGADPGQALLGEGSHQNPSEQFGAKTAPPGPVPSQVGRGYAAENREHGL